ncbi:sensor histidine kinase [Neobacillus muris]|uniref:sensor histidine kinase n=1 Tax=Neobacillus muris TaxID=2941334 RepID=UPI00203DF887|nr:sensor histidine kinase [Neobacillus muris]
MDFWIIFSKLAILLFIAYTSVQTATGHQAWTVLALLIYVCINIAQHTFKNDNLRKCLQGLSIVLSLGSYLFVYPLFCLVLPLSLVELTASFSCKKVILLLISLLPIFYIQEMLRPIYGLTAIFCWMLFCIVSHSKEKWTKNEMQLDGMRRQLEQLTKRLNENTEFIRQSEYTFRLEERNRISQEIHDKIGHSMTGALIQMEAAKRLIDTDKNKAEELLQNAISISKDGIENIRLTLKNLKPPTEQIGVHRLKLLIDDFDAKNLFQTILIHEGNLDVITPIQWKIIHENVTEALTNAMKYSKATQVSVGIKVLNKIIRVEIKDNGIGSGQVTKGLGILGMEERTASVDGTIIIDSSNGFSVTVLLPLTI